MGFWCRGMPLLLTKQLTRHAPTKTPNPNQIPAIVWPQTRARVLTMDFEEGVCATDVQSLHAMHLPLDRVAHLISSVFCEQVGVIWLCVYVGRVPFPLSTYRFTITLPVSHTQQIFSSGWAHCDPHPANVLIRAHPTRYVRTCGRNETPKRLLACRPCVILCDESCSLAPPPTHLNNRPQRNNRKHSPVLVLLDHGLYKQLPTDLRLDYWWVVLACFGGEWTRPYTYIHTYTRL